MNILSCQNHSHSQTLYGIRGISRRRVPYPHNAPFLISMHRNCRFADGVMIVYDITCRYQYEEDVARQLNDVRACTSPNIVIMLVGNKCDLEHHRRVSTEEAMAYAESNSMMFIETSAMDGTNVKEAFLNLVTGQHRTSTQYCCGHLVNIPLLVTLST